MPPRRSARVAAAAAERGASALAPLPLSLALAVFALLPADCRLRCAAVCRSWRSALRELSLWTRLDLTVVRASSKGFPLLLRRGASLANGGLQSLQLSSYRVSDEVLLEVVGANAGALHVLDLTFRDGHDFGYDFLVSSERIEALMAAAPLIHTLAANVEFDNLQAARRALRNETPYEPLQLHELAVNFSADDDPDEVLQLYTDIEAHTSLAALHLRGRNFSPAEMDALVDLALQRGLKYIEFNKCSIPDDPEPDLARLLGSRALRTLKCYEMHLTADWEAPSGLLAQAIRDTTTLTTLELVQTSLFEDVQAGIELLNALEGHVSLRVLRISEIVEDNDFIFLDDTGQAALSAAFAALIAANAPALVELEVACGRLTEDDDWQPFFEALPLNTHLRSLNFYAEVCVSVVFARDVLLPALRANTSLRRFRHDSDRHIPAEDVLLAGLLREAEALLAERPPCDW